MKTTIQTALALVSKALKDMQEAQRILTDARFKELELIQPESKTGAQQL